MAGFTQNTDDFDSFFEEQYGSLHKDLESRRRRYLRSFRNRLIIGLLFLVFLPQLFTVTYSELIDAGYDMERQNLVFMPVILAIFTIVYIVWPLARYRTRVNHIHFDLKDRLDFLRVPEVSWFNPFAIVRDMAVDGWRRVLWLKDWVMRLGASEAEISDWETTSLKHIIFHHVFNAFAEFKFRPRGMNARINLMQPLLLPPHDEYRAEDNVTGAYHNAMLDIAEAQLIRIHHGERQALFRGLFITIDIRELDVKINRDFDGRTAMIDKDISKVPFMERRFEKYEVVEGNDIPDRFRLFATNSKEARAMVTPDVLVLVSALEVLFSKVKIKKQGWDIPFVDAITKPFRANYVGRMDGISDAHTAAAINAGVQMAFYEDKVQLTVPCALNLFEAPSVLEDPLDRDELELIYHMMMIIGELTDVIYRNKHAYDERQFRLEEPGGE